MMHFDYKQRVDYPYFPGMTVAFMTPDLNSNKLGTVKRSSYNYLELTTGEIVNKSLVYAMLSKEKPETEVKNAG